MSLAYAYPTAGVSFVSFMFTLYIFKFSTDVLLIAPAIMGTIYAVARIWDGISDPLAGYFSDRTKTKYGRRRPWLFASALPMAIVPVLVWSPPMFLDHTGLIVWMTVGVLAYETMLTIFYVPHYALGAELSMDHHERTKVFAFRQVAWSIGFFACIGAVYLLGVAEDKRSMAFMLSLVGGTVAALLIFGGALQLREDDTHVGRGSANPYKAFADVIRNRHARMLLIVFLIESLGTATLGIMAPYYMEYVIKAESGYTLLLLFHFIPTLMIIPVGVVLSKHFGKKNLWAVSMVFSAVSYAAMGFAGAGDLNFVLFCVMGTGIATGIGSVVGPSVQADVIDYDEVLTGERKEGAYFAVWNFIRKTASSITAFIAGFAMQFSGFVPNVEQTEWTQLVIVLLYAGLPAASMIIGVALFQFGFGLDEEEHERIRSELDARAAVVGDTPAE